MKNTILSGHIGAVPSALNGIREILAYPACAHVSIRWRLANRGRASIPAVGRSSAEKGQFPSHECPARIDILRVGL
ncbi:hypothetical protein [Mesorhizobium sp. B263B2A]|uniref:hypothetical protein n=1 Tax=Mesorhizobium sp. B263B2A TaxID=2876669 RepID=UPI001CD189BC|nr:hypothetical protein [Mesorhizobium sp. B263B2A]MCA0035500.1 hypothetical protein [Mesorhizobium sp. B263B2A]